MYRVKSIQHKFWRGGEVKNGGFWSLFVDNKDPSKGPELVARTKATLVAMSCCVCTCCMCVWEKKRNKNQKPSRCNIDKQTLVLLLMLLPLLLCP